MHQPIQWHEWGEEAFAAAQRDNKPILLDIGAVWCHWCHVMDRESYEDPEVAAIVNEKFVAIKVDRDERPDIDIRYQTGIQAVSGQGGWPLTAFLTPDGKPFYGGTYFPPADGYGRPSFRRVLLSIAAAYHEKNGDVLEQAKLVETAIAHSEASAGRGGSVSRGIIDQIQDSSLKMFDAEHGGFGQAPKFPHPSALDLLISQYSRSGDQQLRHVIVISLEHMARGGVYDQLAGGFHRYSVDERWVVPHFEKMSYDNSELLKNYVHGYQATGSEFFAGVARDIIRWMDDWLSDRERGGFFASQDADISLDDDGDYFTWTLEETRAVLAGEEETRAAALHYDINEIGEMHHNPAKNVLHVVADIDEIAERMKLTGGQAAALLASAKKKMYAARLLRPTPYIDKTIYTGWNGLCVSAYLEAAKVLGLVGARQFALKSLDRILSEAWNPRHEPSPGSLLHVIAYSDPQAGRREVPGVLDDYTATVLACLDAYEATADLSYYKFARAIGDAMIAKFYDSTAGGFFDSHATDGAYALGVLATQRKPLQDSPTPAGNPMAAIALLRLHDYTGDESYRLKAEDTLEAFAGIAGQYGMFAATYGLAVERFMSPHTQVVVVEAEGDRATAAGLYAAASGRYAVNKSVIYLKSNEAVATNLPPALALSIPALPALQGPRSFATLCSENACQPPVFEVSELRSALDALPA